MDNHRPTSGLHDFLEGRGVSIGYLQTLNAWINNECLQFTSERESTHEIELTSEDLVSIILKLSAPLERARNPDSPVFIETQLRTLIAAFAVLRFRGIFDLEARTYEEIRSSNLRRLESVILTLPNKESYTIRQNTNLYLIQLAVQYLSLFECTYDRRLETTVPVLNIAFAAFGLPGGQYGNTQQILRGIGQIATIWYRRDTTEHPLCGLQEHVRRTTALLTLNDIWGGRGLETIDRQILDQTLEQIETVFQDEFEENPHKLPNWHRFRRTVQAPPPDINRGYYFFGLLDCTAQLAAVLDLTIIHPILFSHLEDIVFETQVEEFRLKAIEAMLSHSRTRQSVCERLLRRLRNCSRSERGIIRNDVRRVYDSFGVDVGARRDEGIESIAPDVPSLPMTELSDTSEMDWREKPPRRYIVSRQNVLTPPRKKTIPKHCDNVGLSNDCNRVFFWSTSMITIFELKNCMSISQLPEASRLVKPSHRREVFEHVAIGKDFMATISAGERCGTCCLSIRNVTSENGVPYRSIREGWEARDLRVHESDKLVEVLVAQHRTVGPGRYHAQILIYRFSKLGPQLGGPTFLSINVPNEEFVKQLSIKDGGRRIAAVTHKNRVLVWDSKEALSLRDATPFEYRHGDYTTAEGVTSTSLYQPSSSENTYALCTTSPGPDRARATGEWSFIVPVMSNPTMPSTPSNPTPTASAAASLTPSVSLFPIRTSSTASSTLSPPSSSSDEPPAHLIRDLQQFGKRYGPLTTSAVSSTASILAVVEKTNSKTRKVRYLNLEAHTQGGISCGPDVPMELGVELAGNNRAGISGDCVIQFNPAGTHLFAVDHKGKIVVTEFCKA